MVTFRQAAVDDAPIITHQRCRMFESMGYTDPTAIQRMEAEFPAWVAERIQNGRYIGVLIDDAGLIVGGGGMELYDQGPNPMTTAPQRAYFLNVYIEPTHRRQGLARQLLLVMLDSCREMGIERVDLHASEMGRPLYDSLGFQISGELRLMLK